MAKELLVYLSKTEYIAPVLEAGADAVCIRYRSVAEQSGEDYFIELNQCMEYVHSLSKKIYLSFDIFAHNEDIERLRALLTRMAEGFTQQPDAIVVSDPGVFRLVKKAMPEAAIHISSAMNVTNDSTCNIWKKLGAVRVAIANVLTADSAELLAKHCSKEIELEAFVYGIPCISYSGRKLLSGFLEECHAIEEQTGYYVVEEQRQGEYYKVEQDQRGTYVYDSKTRNWLSDISRLSGAGIFVFSIEGMLYDARQLVDTVVKCRKAMATI